MRIALALLLTVISASLTAAPRRRVANPPQVTVSDEIAVGTLEYDATRAAHNVPRLASSGTDSIAVWRTAGPGGRNALYFVRIDAQGRPLDVPHRLLPVEAGAAWDVAWNGREYVVFADGIVRIARDGRIVAVQQPAVSNEKASAVAIASNGETLGLLRSVFDRLDFYLLDLDGRVLRRVDLGVPARDIALAGGSAGYVAAFSNGSGITVQRFARDGSPDSQRNIGGANASAPDVTFAGDEVYVVWSENGIRAARPFSSSAVTAIPTPLPALSPQIAWNPRTGAVTAVWKQDIGPANLNFRWALHAADVTEPSPVVRVLDDLTDSWALHETGPVPPPAIVATEAGLLVAWTDGPSIVTPMRADVFAVILDTTPAERISTRARAQLFGDIAALPGSVATVWIEDGSLWAEVNDRAPFRIGSAAESAPHIATNGAGFFVVWLDRAANSLISDVRLARLDREGNLLAAPVTVSQNLPLLGADIACATADCVVTWSTPTGVVGHRITPNGTLIGFAPFAIGAALFDFTIASNGRDYLAAYSTGATVETAHIVDGVVLPAVQLVGSRNVEIASNGDDWLVVTRQADRFRFSRMTAAGALASDNFLPAPGFSAFRVAWTGIDYVFAASRQGDIVAGHIDAEGRVMSASSATLIAGSPDEETPAGIASMGDGTAYILYSRAAAEHGLAPRLFMRVYDPVR